ncbi:MAG: ROK family glucokinase [Lachnospiraceae bacterium]|jgi:glucokinase|nr:ROK family glucokinase [Lachnospiraceae bacterium]
MQKYVFGVDVGGTTVKIGYFDLEGNVLDKWEIPTRTEDGGKNILPDVAQSIKDKMAEKGIAQEEVAGVGAGVPGPVDGEGHVDVAVNLGWKDVQVRDELQNLLGVPAMAGNDANVAALGEMWRGGGLGCKNLVAVTLGTGIGGGIIIDGKLLTGADGAGGEIGHIHIVDDEPNACGCGNHGCLEQYGSATGVVTLAKRRLAKDDKASVLRDGELSAKAVFDAVKAGDEVAIDIAKEFGEILGKGLGMIASVVNPEMFVIGGGVSKAGEVLFDYIKPSYEKYVFRGSLNTRFALATLGNDAGIYGAAKLVLDAR